MDAVAVVARRGDDETHFQQRATMNAVVELRCHVGIFHLVFRGDGFVRVASRAGARKVQLEHWREPILHRHHVVRAVAVPAIRRTGGPQLMAQAVNARGVFRDGFFVPWLGLVAPAALWLGQTAFVDEILDAGVAVHTINLCVNGFVEVVRRENSHRHRLTAHLFGVRRIGVAIEAVLVLELRSGLGFRSRQAGLVQEA